MRDTLRAMETNLLRSRRRTERRRRVARRVQRAPEVRSLPWSQDGGSESRARCGRAVMRKTWDLSCLDWQERLRSGHPPIPDLPLDKLAADQAVNVYNRLRLHDVIGTPTRGEAGGEWFRQAVVRPLFGSIDPETGERFIREIFLLVPKKNDKTGGGAAVMMTALFLNKRPRG